MKADRRKGLVGPAGDWFGKVSAGLEETVGPEAEGGPVEEVGWQRELEAGIGLDERLGPEGRMGWGGEDAGLSCWS